MAGTHKLVIFFLAYLLMGRLGAADDKLVRSLSAAIDTWSRSVEFVCTYELLSGESSTLENARAGQFIGSPVRVTGIFAKKGELYRISLDDGDPTTRSGDATRKGELMVDYLEPAHTSNPADGRVWVTRYFGLMDLSAPFAGRFGVSSLNPLVPMSNALAMNPIRYLDSFGYTMAANHVGEDRVEVQMVSAGDDQTVTTTLTFCLRPEIPVITRVVIKGFSVHETHLEDFVQVTGGTMASTVRALSRRDAGGYGLRIWRSEDLGRRKPSHDDFVIRVPEQVTVRCLQPASIPEAVNGIRVFDVSRFTLDDLLPDCHSPETAPPVRSTRWPLRLVGLIGMLLGAGCWGLLYLHRRRRRGH